MGMRKCHEKFCIFTNSRSLAQETACRVDSYNRVVDAVQKAVNALCNNLGADPSAKKNVIELNGKKVLSWNIYEEISSIIYWIDLTEEGYMIEGMNRHGEKKIAQRYVSVRHITDADEVSHLDNCFSVAGLLDFCTLIQLCDRILCFCAKFGLCDQPQVVEDILLNLPPMAVENFRQQSLAFGTT